MTFHDDTDDDDDYHDDTDDDNGDDCHDDIDADDYVCPSHDATFVSEAQSKGEQRRNTKRLHGGQMKQEDEVIRNFLEYLHAG